MEYDAEQDVYICKNKKHLEVSKVFYQKRTEDLERILSNEGCQLRMNRSIQAEGSFADICVEELQMCWLKVLWLPLRTTSISYITKYRQVKQVNTYLN